MSAKRHNDHGTKRRSGRRETWSSSQGEVWDSNLGWRPRTSKEMQRFNR